MEKRSSLAETAFLAKKPAEMLHFALRTDLDQIVEIF